MKVIIAGSRKIIRPEPVLEAVQLSKFTFTGIVSGGATGVDTVAIYVAGYLRLPCPDIFYANWGKGPRRDPSAGYKRNRQMGDYADALLAVWDGESRGTKHMIEYMQKLNKLVYVHIVGVEA